MVMQLNDIVKMDPFAVSIVTSDAVAQNYTELADGGGGGNHNGRTVRRMQRS